MGITDFEPLGKAAAIEQRHWTIEIALNGILFVPISLMQIQFF